MGSTIFERCGGFAKVRRIVAAFYDKILASATLQKYFERVDMRALIDHQTKFIASAMGGPASYTDETLQRVHAPLRIPRGDFLEMAGLLRETLEEFGLAKDDVEQVYNEVLRREPYIVARAQ
jgi:hemoglobin